MPSFSSDNEISVDVTDLANWTNMKKMEGKSNVFLKIVISVRIDERNTSW